MCYYLYPVLRIFIQNTLKIEHTPPSSILNSDDPLIHTINTDHKTAGIEKYDANNFNKCVPEYLKHI
jgi:hypothetical protein